VIFRESKGIHPSVIRHSLSVLRQRGAARVYDRRVEARSGGGTNLAPGASVTTSGFHVVRAAETRAAATEWVRLKPPRIAPSIVVVLGLLIAARFPGPRIAVVGAVYGAMFVYQLVEAARARRSGVDERSLFLSHLLLLAMHAVIIGATGGMHSPLWPGLFGNCLGTLNIFGKSRESSITVGLSCALTVIVALLPDAIRGPAIDAPFHTALSAWTILFTLFLLRKSSFALGDAFRRTEATLDTMREDVIAAATERAKSLESIGSKVAHELKNPLSAIKGLVQLLKRGASDEKSTERLGVICSEVTRMEGILRDYLSFSRPLEDLKRQPVELGALADDVCSVLEARAEVAGVSLQRTGGAARVVGDPRRLKEALLNLVSNALEATPRLGEVEVAITNGVGVSDAQIEIRDTGKGMGAEELARVGTPFFTTREGGTGLGVVLARAVIEQHGGAVTYASDAGRGTRVTVQLPATPPDDRPHAAPPQSEARAHG
jgi:signal transduction histidine kinase